MPLRQYRACVVDSLGLGITCVLYHSTMCTRHPDLVSFAFYAFPIFHIIIFNLLVARESPVLSQTSSLSTLSHYVRDDLYVIIDLYTLVKSAAMYVFALSVRSEGSDTGRNLVRIARNQLETELEIRNQSEIRNQKSNRQSALRFQTP